MALLVFITNRFCDSWIAKGIVIFAVIGTLVYFSMCSKKRKEYQQKTEDEAKAKANRR
jgi:nucleoside recognition membrane protein YjiH